jgi:toxin FitB
MIILDTNVLSELMREEPDPSVVQWLDRQPPSSVWTTSINLMEARLGLLSMPAGKRSVRLTQEFEAALWEEIEERHTLFDIAAAEQAAILMVERKLKGRPIDFRDTMIAGIVISRNAILATRNTAHFSDLGSNMLNPWNS